MTNRSGPIDDAIGGHLIGAVLCGGQSRRFGSDKALAPVGGRLMGERVVGAMRDAGVDPVVAVGGTAGLSLGVVTVPDRWPGEGPLAALATILWWVRTGDVLVAPCDMPRLTGAAVAELVAARNELRSQERNDAVVAAAEGEPNHALAIWPAEHHRLVHRLVDGGERRYRAALDVLPWTPVEVPHRALADADTAAELDELLDES